MARKLDDEGEGSLRPGRREYLLDGERVSFDDLWMHNQDEEEFIEALLALEVGESMVWGAPPGMGAASFEIERVAPLRKNPKRRPPPVPPSHTFQLEASAVQQHLFSKGSYEPKPEEKPEPEHDERQADLFSSPSSRKNPRPTYPDGRLIPVVGDEVYQTVRGFMGAGGSLLGVVVKGRGDTLRVRLTGYSGMMPTTDVVEGKMVPFTPAWTVITDPIHDAQAAAKKRAQSSKEEIKQQAAQAVADYVEWKGWKPAVLEKLQPGTLVFMPYSEGRWGTGDPQNVNVEEAVVEEVTPRYFIYNGGATSGPQGWFVAALRENKANQSFIRRTPSRAGSKRNYRYTYDVALAARVNVRANPREKLRIPYKGRIGHYEVVARLSPDVVGVVHDEAGHHMVISDLCLRELVRDTYSPSEDASPREDVRYQHEREDALPRSRDDVYRMIQQASGIQDHDFAQADQAYRKWKAGKGKRGRPKPPPWRGGGLDAFEVDLPRQGRARKHFSSLLEAFEYVTRGARTWRDIEPVLGLLRDTPGFEEARFPDEVYEHHARHDVELDEQGHTIDVELYGVTLPADATPDDVAGAVFVASTTTPPRLQTPPTEEEAAWFAREEAAMHEEEDPWSWA